MYYLFSSLASLLRSGVPFGHVVLLLLVAHAHSLLAQAPAGKAATSEAKKIPAPENIKVEVRDPYSKLELACTYYGSTLGKEAVPVLLLHGFEGSRADYNGLALALQQAGHAVLVPDLRGHGDSTSLLRADGKREEILAKKLTPNDLAGMISDLDAIKSWLLERNNAGELNLEQLVVVGADFSTVTALNWAMRDWNAPVLLNYKNAQDVKALVLLSPEHTWKTTNTRLALKHPAVGGQLSVMIIVGSKSSRPLDEARRMDATLKRQHNEVNTDKKPQDRNIVYVPVETNLQGTKLLDRNLNTLNTILKFIEFRVKNRADEFEYSQRIKP